MKTKARLQIGNKVWEGEADDNQHITSDIAGSHVFFGSLRIDVKQPEPTPDLWPADIGLTEELKRFIIRLEKEHWIKPSKINLREGDLVGQLFQHEPKLIRWSDVWNAWLLTDEGNKLYHDIKDDWANPVSEGCAFCGGAMNPNVFTFRTANSEKVIYSFTCTKCHARVQIEAKSELEARRKFNQRPSGKGRRLC